MYDSLLSVSLCVSREREREEYSFEEFKANGCVLMLFIGSIEDEIAGFQAHICKMGEE